MSALVNAARGYIGVPFVHQGRSRAGLDCAGLVLAAFRDCGHILPDLKGYGREPNKDALIKTMTLGVGNPIAISPVRESVIQPGDVVAVRYVLHPHHIALITDYLHGGLGVIHCDGHSKRVVEHRLSPDMIDRITHVFRKPV